MSQSRSSDVPRAPTCVQGVLHAHRATPSFCKLEKALFKNNVLKLTDVRHYQKRK